ncbi:hypothetical protein OAT18_00640 [Tenacibaculum sp.]|nr:hypothetical protein [Tenacibaculum sp.]
MNTNEKGRFEIGELKKIGVEVIVIYKPNYEILEFKTEKIPQSIHLKKKVNIVLENIEIRSKSKGEKYFKVIGYARSWQIINNKLTKYGDALIEYHIPYKTPTNNIITGVKKYITGYRTFKIPGMKQKSRIISFSGFDNFFNINIPRQNILIRQHYENYKIKKSKYGIFNIIKNEEKIGHVIYDKDSIPLKISLEEKFKNDEEEKNIFWKFSSSSKNIEEWRNNGKERYLSYLFSNDKKIIKTKIGESTIEVINEIFFEDEIRYIIKKPRKSKRHIDKDRSFYSKEFWKEKLIEYPLPRSIKKQLIKINENKNRY